MQTHTSERAHLSLRNAQLDLSPVFPQSAETPGLLNDLTTAQIGNSPALHAIYVIDTPLRSINESFGPKWDDTFQGVGVGGAAGFNLTWAIVAWGYDTIGVGYFVIYEHSPPNSAFDIFSRSDGGPSPETLRSIDEAMRKLGDQQLSQIIDRIVPMVQNGARRGSPPFQCDATCINDKEGCRAIGIC